MCVWVFNVLGAPITALISAQKLYICYSSLSTLKGDYLGISMSLVSTGKALNRNKPVQDEWLTCLEHSLLFCP